jgi:secreted Zn-dependent insulinase-like peptidase
LCHSGSPPGPPVLSHPLYRLDDLGIRIQLTPVKETRKLALTFPLPCVDEYYDKKTLTFLSHLIGWRGRQPALPAQGAGWVNQLAAGGGISGANFEDFGELWPHPLGLSMWTRSSPPCLAT